MNLVLDIGNTCCKICVFDDNKLIDKQISKSEISAVTDILAVISQKYKFSGSIMSSVSLMPEGLQAQISQVCNHNFVLTSDLPVPIKNSYSTPKTLGNDRLAAVVGASCLFPGRSALVIDAGTAITYDFLMNGNEYVGGNIAPGISLRFRSLNDHTKRLPLIEEYDWAQGFGNSTADALRKGVLNGLAFEIEGYVRDFQANYSDSVIILTGGDCFFLLKRIKNTIFAEPNLVAIGLNRILNYNVSKNF